MFEKYTERAVAVITTAQDISKEMKHNRVYPEHILLGLILNKSGICANLFNLYKIDYSDLKQDVQRVLYPNRVMNPTGNLLFSRETRDILRRISKLLSDFKLISRSNAIIYLCFFPNCLQRMHLTSVSPTLLKKA